MYYLSLLILAGVEDYLVDWANAEYTADVGCAYYHEADAEDYVRVRMAEWNFAYEV